MLRKCKCFRIYFYELANFCKKLRSSKVANFRCNLYYQYSEAATRVLLCKKVFLEISQNSQESTCARASFLIKLQGEEKLKGCVRYILLVCFVCLQESTCETRKNAFYFTLKALLVLEIIKF